MLFTSLPTSCGSDSNSIPVFGDDGLTGDASSFAFSLSSDFFDTESLLSFRSDNMFSDFTFFPIFTISYESVPFLFIAMYAASCSSSSNFPVESV